MKRQKTFVFDSDTESENYTYCAGHVPLLAEKRFENNVLHKLEDFTINNLQSVSQVTESIFDNDLFDFLIFRTKMYHQQNKKSNKIYERTVK